jgi:hypothetical protein
MTRTRLLLTTLLLALGAVAASCTLGSSPSATASPSASVGEMSSAAAPATATVRHVFVVNLENKGYAETFGAGSKAPYLAQTLRARGQLLTHYYGTAHNSLPNYLAQISGQGPNPQTQADCRVYSRFVRTGTVAPGQAVGNGCVYPRNVRTVADQLSDNGLRWRGYMEDMGRGCRHPRLDSRDDTQRAGTDDQYAARHNPFVYFRSITSRPRYCAAHVVGLGRLADDLRSARRTRNLSYITPDLCSDAHDTPCADGRPGGLASANAWLERWVPRILAAPAYRRNGVLVITFDEAESRSPDGADACCGEGPAPNAPLPGIDGPGGGRVGAVVLSPYVVPGSTNHHPYNHYSLLRSVEDWFGLGALGYARQAQAFGRDVLGRG